MKSRATAFAAMILTVCGRAEPVDVSAALERIRVVHQIPAIAAAAYDEKEILAEGATGRRRARGNEPVTLADKWHLGSCTKSMTASVAAMLVEEGKLHWESTIGEVFPELLKEMAPAWRTVTLEDLLWHRAGAPHEPPTDVWKIACERRGTATEQRFEFSRGILRHPPEFPPGSHWTYSDSGYAIAGAMMERVAKCAWEDLLRDRLFKPLGLTSAGFGEPSAPGGVDQPWGHRGEYPPFRPVPPGPTADNPPAIGPAATVHMSIGDFVRYAAWQVAGANGNAPLLSAESFEKLQTPPDGQRYAMGWAACKRRWAGGTALMHNGENTMFYAVMWLGPAEKTCFVAACNCDGPAAQDACDEAIAMMINKF